MPQNYYQEKYRPQYHFSPKSNWMNDPNGMFYYKGKYHLFFQYYPNDTIWGPMHWGHAVSQDLVHWEELPIAIFPDHLGYIFSGSAVVDSQNTSGLKSGEEDPVIAIFTYHLPNEFPGTGGLESQGIAYSTDGGNTWHKYSQNPVLANPGIKDFRDPKVFWHAKTSKWIMSLAAGQEIIFYSSSNLLQWQEESRFGSDKGAHGGVWECPDLFPLISSNAEEKWILLVSINPGGPNGGNATQYFVGDFDGSKFISEQKAVKWVDMGRDNYAGVTWANIPESDGRSIFLAWMSNWDYGQQSPTNPWRSAMTLPRVMHVDKINNEWHLKSEVAREVYEKLHYAKPKEYFLKAGQALELPEKQCYQIKMKHSETNHHPIIFSFLNHLGDVATFEFDIQNGIMRFFRNYLLDGDFSKKFVGEQKVNYPTMSGALELELWVDQSSIELFLNHGILSFTNQVFPQVPFEKMELKSGGSIQLVLKEIDSIWRN